LWLVNYAGGGVSGAYTVSGAVTFLLPTNSYTTQPTEADVYAYLSRNGTGTITEVRGILTAQGSGSATTLSGWYMPQYLIFNGDMDSNYYYMGSIGAFAIHQNGALINCLHTQMTDTIWGGYDFQLNGGSKYYGQVGSALFGHQHATVPLGAISAHTHSFTPAGTVSEHTHTYNKPTTGTAVNVAPNAHTHTITPEGTVGSHTHTGPSHTHTITAA
jgi:hypothetical protein